MNICSSLRTLAAAATAVLLATAGYGQSNAHPYKSIYLDYGSHENPITNARVSVAMEYNARLWAAVKNMKYQLNSQAFTDEGRAFVDFFNHNGDVTGDVQGRPLIGERAWESWGKWGISARYCDNFLMVYYKDPSAFKSSLTATDVLLAPLVQAERVNYYGKGAGFIDVRHLPMLNWINSEQIVQPGQENQDVPDCIRDDYFDRGPSNSPVLYLKFKLAQFPDRQFTQTEKREIACEGDQIGSANRQRRILTRWKTGNREWLEDEWQAGPWESLGGCREPRRTTRMFTDACFASEIGRSGATALRGWRIHVKEVKDPSSDTGAIWAITDAEGNIGSNIDPELVFSLCDDNAPPAIGVAQSGRQQTVQTISCNSRHSITYRPDVPWSGSIIRTESWDETLQSVPFEELKEIRIRENLTVNEVDNCLRHIVVDGGLQYKVDAALCRYEGVGQYQRRRWHTYEDRASTGPHSSHSTMRLLRTTYDSWQVWRNDCYRTTSSYSTQTRNAGCGSGYSGHTVERRSVQTVSVRHEQLRDLDRNYNVYGDWARVDNLCYYVLTQSWCEEKYGRHGYFLMYNILRRTAYDRRRVYEDTRKGTTNLGRTYSGWWTYRSNQFWRNMSGYGHSDERTFRESRLARAPWVCGGYSSSHPSVSSSGSGGRGSTSVDVNGDGVGDYANLADAVAAGHSGTFSMVSGSCGTCNGPRDSSSNGGNNSSGNGGRSFWDKVKDFFRR